MEWRCAACGQSYDEPPESCACGAMSLEPVPGDSRDATSLEAVAAIRGRLFDPVEADGSHPRDEPDATLLLRFMLLVALLGALMLVVLALT